MKKLLITIILFVPLLARADLIEYEFSGTSDAGPGWTILGSVILDENDAIAGVNLIDDFVSWGFSWTDGTDTFSTSSASNAFFLPSLHFIIDTNGEVSSVSLCTDDCTVGKPVSNVQLTTWNASIGVLFTTVGGNREGSWSGAIPVTDLESVTIDIKFCSDPNSFNCRKKGVLPVTIFGTASFDPLDIDPSTLQLCLADGVTCTNAPIAWSIEDRGDPTSDLGASMCAINPTTGLEQHFLNPDGFLDLDVDFNASEVQGILGGFCGGPKNGVSPTLIIIGSTFGGIPITSAPIGNTGIDQLVKKNK